jgi:hypothetical protein
MVDSIEAQLGTGFGNDLGRGDSIVTTKEKILAYALGEQLLSHFGTYAGWRSFLLHVRRWVGFCGTELAA